MTYQYQINDIMLRRVINDITLRPSSNETLLIAFCLEHQTEIPILSEYPYLVEYEYEAETGFSNKGKGDLILTDGNRNYLIVEAKYLSQATGNTATQRRRYQRKKVKEQVSRYLSQFTLEFPTTKVDGFALTNEILSDELKEEFEVYRQRKENIWKKRRKSLYPKTKKKLVT